MNDDRQVVVDRCHEQLPATADAGERPAVQRAQRRVVGLQRIDARSERGLDARTRNRSADTTRGDLDLR